MKLLFVHERFGALAGAESNILATATELRRRGHNIGILHGARTGKGETAWEAVFGQRYHLKTKQNISRVRAALSVFQPDVVYIHKMADVETLETLLAIGVPLIRMVHDHDLYCMRSYKYNYFTRKICHRALSPFCIFPCGAFVARNHDSRLPFKLVSYSEKIKELLLNQKFQRLIVAGSFMKEELLRNGFMPEKIVIHPPVPPPGDPVLQSNFSDRNVLIYAGQIVRGKGVDVLLEALAQVRTPFECFIFGDGNHRRTCEYLAVRLGLNGRVHFKGYVPQDELQLHYREASVAVVSSVWPEPFGAVGLEAMRYGLPVVAFDAGGIKEWLINGQNGYLVPWMDRTAFAGRVEELLRNKQRARDLGEQGRQMVSTQFEFSKYIDSLEDLFTEIGGKTHQAANT